MSVPTTSSAAPVDACTGTGRTAGAFYAVEGIDGSGKSHLVRRLAQEGLTLHGRPVTAVLKDDLRHAGESHDSRRLAAMHAITWSYPADEEVWRYSQRYWLHTLLSWYQLSYERQVQPHLEAGRRVVTDGWFFKHWARFSLSPDRGLRATAEQLFLDLPGPDAVLLLDTAVGTVTERLRRVFKPSEAGAFEAGHADVGLGDLSSYQTKSATALRDVLDNLGVPVERVDTSAGDDLASLAAAIENIEVLRP